MGKTSYQTKWQESFPWLAPVKPDLYKAYCKHCLKTFRPFAQVRSHANCHKKDEFGTQRTFVTQNGESVLSPKQKTTFSPEDQVVNAEILQALHFADCNYSFAKTDADRFREMFPDSMIAKSYQQSTKVKYIIQYGIAPYVKEKLIYDIRNKPFTFKFDETTNRKSSCSIMVIFNIGQELTM